jgi:PAS domain S-box-containing protein
VELAARLLTPDQVSRRFVSELNRGYLVVEVALAPKETPFEVNRTDFALRSSEPEIATGAQSPELAAATLQRTAPSSRGVRVMPQVGIGYETGSGGRYDPATRTYRRGGLTSSVGVSVGGRARGGLPAACGRPAGRPVGTQPWLWRRMYETAASWAGEEAGLERREDRPPRANRPNGVKRPGRRRARNGEAVGCRTSGRARKGRDGPRRGCGGLLEGRVRVCVAHRRRCGRPGATLAHRGEASSVRGEETVAAGLERFRRGRCANDRHWTMDFISDGCRAITGRGPEDFVGNRTLAYAEIVHPEHRERLWRDWQEVLSRHGIFEGEYPVIHADGETRWVWERGRGVFSESGRLLYLEGFIADTTERRQAAERLRESEQKFRLLAENTLDVIWQLDLDLRITYVNPASERLFGYPPQELIGTRLSDHCDPKEMARMAAIVADRVERPETDTGVVFETFFRHRDGQRVATEIHGSVLADARGRPVALQGTARDITERKRAEEALRESEDRLNRIIHSIDDVLYGVDGETGEFVFLSPSFERVLGYTLDDIARMGGRREFLRRVIQDDRFRDQDRLFGELRSDGRTEPPVWEAWWRRKPGPEDGIGGPAGRRRGPRFQQHAQRDPGAHGNGLEQVDPGDPFMPTSRRSAKPPTFRRDHPATAGLCPQADRRRPSVLDLNETWRGCSRCCGG